MNQLIKPQLIKVMLRLALGIAFLSAVADRFGFWPAEVSAWGNFDAFLSYTGTLAPWVPKDLIPALGWSVTVLEVLLGVFLISGIKIRLSAQISGLLLLTFALSMSLTSGVKGALDYSVFSAVAAAFALSFFNKKYLELDQFWTKKNEPN